MKWTGNRFPKCAILASLLFCLTNEGMAEENRRFFDMGVGTGTDLFGWLETGQVLLAPAVNWKIEGQDRLLFRVEGDIEFVDDYKKQTFVLGMAPMLRYFLSENGDRPKPFLEAAAGANMSTYDKINGRDIGDHFLFSGMLSAGVEFKLRSTPMAISYRYRHLSNAGLYSQNASFNSHYLMLFFGLQ